MEIDSLIGAATLAAALGCGLVAGVFFAFSSFVMKALARLPAAQGMAAMQGINVAVLNRAFLGLFLGTAVLSLAVALAAAFGAGVTGLSAPCGAALYLCGTVLVTGLGNVPLNQRLAGLQPGAPGSATAWRRYLRPWTTLNHLRTACAALASLLLSLSPPGAAGG